MKATVQIFLCCAREDEEKVEKLHQELSDAGFKPWMDKKDILPGEMWEVSIQKAIQGSDFFLMCLSANSVDKRGWIQREIKQALDIWQEMLEDDIYLIPVRLEDCEVPENLRKFQWVNLFGEDGWTQLVKAIQVGMERRAKVLTDEEYSLLRRAREGPEWQKRNLEETASLFSVSVSQLQDALAMLASRHRKVLEFRYGLTTWDGEKRTYEEIAQDFGVPTRRIRELEQQGLVKLKQALSLRLRQSSP